MTLTGLERPQLESGGWNPGQGTEGVCAHVLLKRKVWLVSLLCQPYESR